MNKNISALLLVLAFTLSSHGQSKLTSTFIEVDGLCGMCKNRIENAAYLPGVKKVNWNKESHQLELVFLNKKVSQEEIIASINSIGHDVKGSLASEEQYAKVHGCCKYRDTALRANHGLGEALCTQAVD
jgi:copper chaperone CopZ